MNVVECSDLAVRYRRHWALRDCSLAIPAGHIVALVGPNGAGKTTLLHCAVGLLAPTAGKITVLGGSPAGSLEALDGVAFVAQDAPLYKHLSVADMTSLTANLNRDFDNDFVALRLSELQIPPNTKVGKLSGGQQAQLALALALGRRPRLLVLDEPLARLDPLARHNFMAIVMAAVSEGGLSVLFSSHVVSELERVADYLIVLSNGRLQMAGAIDDLLAGHSLLTGPIEEVDQLSDAFTTVQVQRAGRQAQLLVRNPGDGIPRTWEASEVSLEELVLAYLGDPAATALPGPFSITASRAIEMTR